MTLRKPTRRQFHATVLSSLAAASLPTPIRGEKPDSSTPDSPLELRYVLASALYGLEKLETVLDQVKPSGAESIDLWPRVHGNQREQAGEMGPAAFREALEARDIRLGGIACYRPGPFALDSEIEFVSRVGARDVVLVTTARGPRDLSGKKLKEALRAFLTRLEPTIPRVEKAGCILALENHSGSLLSSPDGIRWMAELLPGGPVGIALAPHHLEQDGRAIGKLARDLGPAVKFFYAQQHGKGSSRKMPVEDELLQLPGRGPLDFVEILRGLRDARFRGLTEIFMHPVPRGRPVLETPAKITAEVVRARKYLERCLEKVNRAD